MKANVYRQLNHSVLCHNIRMAPYVMSCWEEALIQTHETLKTLHLSAGLGMPWVPLQKRWKSISAQIAAPTTQTHISSRKQMDG